MLIDRLSINVPLEEPIILQLPASYCTAITHNLIGLLEGRLVYYEPVPTVTNHICRIIVPLSLRCTIFTLMYVTPVSERMGEYKILYRIKLKFFWPRLRSDDTEWIKQCPHSMITYRRRRQGQQLIFSWPISSPFAILHVDLWMPIQNKDPNSYMALMNAMCDMN